MHIKKLQALTIELASAIKTSEDLNNLSAFLTNLTVEPL